MCLRLIIFAALVAACTPAKAFDFARGQMLEHSLLVCLDQKDAIDLVKIDAEKGFEAAKEAWDKKEKCAGLPVFGPTVGRVVFSAEVKRDGKKLTMKVVEILGEGSKVLAYFLTTGNVAAKLTVPPPTDKSGRTS